MQEFPTNAFLIESSNFLLLLAIMVGVFHLLFVWPRNLSKKSWKRIDYLWLGAAAIGLISLAADVRVSVANNWVEIEKSRALGVLNSIHFLTTNPESSHFCMTFARGEYSPDDFDERQRQYQLGCEWRKKLSKYLQTIKKEEVPPITFEDFPRVLFDDPVLNETVNWLRDRIDDYGDQLEILTGTKKATEKGEWEKFLSYFAPFLICIALALRITKVTGEIRHETYQGTESARKARWNLRKLRLLCPLSATLGTMMKESNLNPELLKMAIENGQYPETLFKYRTFKQIQKILESNNFWFAKPDSFNDPFDCNLSEIPNPDIECLENYLRRLGIEEKTLGAAIQLYSKSPEKVNKLVRDAKDKSIKKRGVLSLSEVHDDILMWSHYSENHSGVVIGLELKEDLDFFLMPLKINYKEKYQELNYLKDAHKSTIETLQTKSIQWSYEKEVRIYKKESGFHEINSKAIKSIYFGVKTPPENIKQIKDICNNKGLNHVQFFQAGIVHGEFRLEFSQI